MPAGAPPPRDWPVWAHRRLDLPLTVPAPARHGRPSYLDPRSEPLSGEARERLPLPRTWVAAHRAWRTRETDLPGLGAHSQDLEGGAAAGDPEAPARARALLVRQALHLEHRMVWAEEAAALLGCTEEEVRRRADAHELLVLPYDEGGLLVPLDQLTGAHVLPGLAEVLQALTEVPIRSPWVMLDWLGAPVDEHGRRCMLELLRDGEAAAAVEIARTYGEQGA